MTEPTTDRPTDTIRDAFEAMLEFFVYLLTSTSASAKGTPGRIGANAASALRLFDSSDSDLLALRGLIQRAAEEHNRRANTGGDFTPERIREARERCAEIERRYQAGLESASSREDLALTVLAIRAAREDLPAAIAEIERLNRLVVATANADPSWVERCTTQAAEIERLATALQAERAAWQEASGADSPGHLTAALKARRARLTAELAARVPALFDGPPRTLYQPNGPDGRPEDAGAPADASLEAAERTWRGEWQRIAADIRSMSEAGKTPADILAILLTHLDMMKPLAVVRAVDASRPAAAIERTLNINALARCARAALRIEVPDVVAWEALPEAERVGWRAVVRCILASTTLASRPGLTEEQAPDVGITRAEAAEKLRAMGYNQATIDSDIRHARRLAALLKSADPAGSVLRAYVAHCDALHARASRGETGPGSDPRATLHAGDPASPFAPGSLAAGSATEDRILDRKRGGK